MAGWGGTGWLAAKLGWAGLKGRLPYDAAWPAPGSMPYGMPRLVPGRWAGPEKSFASSACC